MVIGFAVSLFGYVVAQRSPARIVFLTFIFEIISWCVLIYCIIYCGNMYVLTRILRIKYSITPPTC